MLAALLRPAAALGGAGADKIALHVGEAAEHGDHQSPGAGASVGPRLSNGAKLRLGVDDLLDDGEQVEGAARLCQVCFLGTRKGCIRYTDFRGFRPSIPV